MNTLRVRKALNGLTQDQRELLKLFVLGFTCDQIAKQQERSIDVCGVN